MADTSKQFREALQAIGEYDNFCDHYNTLLEQGETEAKAKQKSVRKFRPSATAGEKLLKEKEANKQNDSMDGRKRSGRKKNENGSDEGSMSGLPEVKEAEFEGTNPDATEAEIIRWVAEKLMSADPNPQDAPNMTAYALLNDCRQFPDFRRDFWKNMWTKLVSKGQIEDNDDDTGGYDGQPTVETIESIENMRQEAEKEVA